MTREAVARDVVVDGKRLETVRYDGDPARPAIVMLHEGLGSISLWRDLPQRLCERTRCTVVAYSRYGYGRSDVLREKREPDYMHREGEVVLPALLAQLEIERPILFGHSDGASIALIYAGAHPERRARARARSAARVRRGDQRAQHRGRRRPRTRRANCPRSSAAITPTPTRRSPAGTTSGSTRAFAIGTSKSYADRVRVPVLLIQGEEDEYGTTAQLDAIVARIPGAETLMVPRAGHSPHRDAPEIVVERIAAFVAEIGTA